MAEYEGTFDFQAKRDLAIRLLANHNVRLVINILKDDEHKLSDHDAKAVCREVIEEVADRTRMQFLTDAYEALK